jgi:RNA polymerase sigma factor (sigma-70 family)
LTPEQEARVEGTLPDVQHCAAQMARRYRNRFKAEDMLGPGTLGLLGAVRTYEPDRHPSFAHYARYYILGAMLNAVRTELFSTRARVEHAMERAFCDFEQHHVLAGSLFMDPEEKLLEGARRGNDDALAAALVALAAEAIQLVHEEGLSVAAAAREIGVHVNTAQARYTTALGKLRAFLLGLEAPRRR